MTGIAAPRLAFRATGVRCTGHLGPWSSNRCPSPPRRRSRSVDLTQPDVVFVSASSAPSAPERDDMNRHLIFLSLLSLALTSSASAAVLEVPQDGGYASGIGYISGWKCPPNDKITVVIDGGDPIPVPSGVRRGDTAGACGNDGRNGFITQINFGLLGSGFHTVAARQNGQAFVTSTFNVTTFGVPFLTGAAGKYTLLDFPTKGKTVDIDWDQGQQNFVITGVGSGPIPSPTPKPSTSARVRYGNNVVCNGSGFLSTLSANGFSWSAFSGGFSSPQNVNRSTLGPFTSFNGTCGNITYPGVFTLTAGRRYGLVQDFENGNPVLRQIDEGAVSSEGVAASSAAEPPVIVTVIGTPDESAAALGEAP